jgi:hypothetical protein
MVASPTLKLVEVEVEAVDLENVQFKGDSITFLNLCLVCA